jgi:GntR family transcriptional regulator
MSTPGSPVRQEPLSQQIKQILIDRIYSGKYPVETRLPAEDDLADEFKVSRATIRSALSILTEMGLVVRRHGSGTYVTKVPRIYNPLDQAIDFQILIDSYQLRPAFDQVYCAVEKVSPNIAEILRIPEGSNILEVQKIFTADDQPVIFCANTISTSFFSDELLQEVLDSPTKLEPFFPFLEHEMSLRVEYFYARVRPLIAQKCKFHIPLPLPKSTPVLEIDEVAFTANGLPIFHTYEYHPENQMRFELVRHCAHRVDTTQKFLYKESRE